MEVLSLTGGEPLLELDRLVELIRHAGRVGIKYIRTGTNGFVFCGNGNPLSADRTTLLAETLAGTPLRNFWISIDSAVPEVHEQMRGFPGVIAGIEKALPIFHRFGLYPSANLGVNRRLGGAQTAKLRIGPRAATRAAGMRSTTAIAQPFGSSTVSSSTWVSRLSTRATR